MAVSELRIYAPAVDIFELIANPARQPEWDVNNNLQSAAEGQRVHAVGESFITILSKGTIRESRVVEFEEGRRVAWLPIDERTGSAPGHLWRYELEPLPDGTTLACHTYDWTNLSDPGAPGSCTLDDSRTSPRFSHETCVGGRRSGLASQPASVCRSGARRYTKRWTDGVQYST